MRRGHPGIGGWRNDNPRHFRPRSGGTQHFRPPRGFGLIENPRFPGPGPGPRPYSGSGSYPRNAPPNDHNPSEHHDRNSYRQSSRQNNQNRSHNITSHYSHNQSNRQIFPLLQRMRRDMPDHAYKDQNYFDNQNQVNTMGDVDHRQSLLPQPKSFNHPPPWMHPPFEDPSPTKSYRHQESVEHNIPQFDFTGHRPPASDHYGGHHSSTVDNSNAFSCSVDDTVDIVRKKLLNRESQHPSDMPSNNQNEPEKEEPSHSSFSNIQQQPATKRKSQAHPRQRNVKSNCDKIKNKIVQQLVRMDKDRIHKLIDNPNSSSKFEYAISSLITESQNSFNRHLRSVAEKSLCTSSTDFMHNDNNTIYEDTFMKQMQCLLDPQDTILLEDMKPMVLAELSKVLQLDNPDLGQETEEFSYHRDDPSQFDQFHNEPYDYEDNYHHNYEPYSPENENYYEQKPPLRSFSGPETPRFTRPGTPRFRDIDTDCDSQEQEFDSNQLFERRKTKASEDRSLKRMTSEEIIREDRSRRRITSEERQRERRSLDNKSEEKRSATPVPLFDFHVEQLSDDEDPFAELDKQYHVAVDHNFIELDVSSPLRSVRSRNPSPVDRKHSPTLSDRFQSVSKIIVETPEKVTSEEIKHEIDSQLFDLAKSPLPVNSNKSDSATTPIKSEIKCENALLNSSYEQSTPEKDVDKKTKKSSDKVHEKQENNPEPNKNSEGSMDKSEVSSKSSSSSHSRKRSADQRPSHRKEKRKKSESESKPSDTSKQILNKNIIINVNDCAGKTTENCDATKSVFNLFFSKEKSNKDTSKENKKADHVDKGYSDKYVKRKESSKHSKEKDKEIQSKKRHDSGSTYHSMQSPPSTDSSNATQTPNKAEALVKLKPIDMFVEQPRKPVKVHEPFRNTAPKPSTTSNTTPSKLSKPIKPIKDNVVVQNKVPAKPMSVRSPKPCQSNTIKKVVRHQFSKFCQTERTRLVTRGSQTEPVLIKSQLQSKDAFERMKEIDIEIQALLQEKFKLYNSLESKESCPSTMQDLGMAVLNVNPVEINANEDTESEDTIVNDFTSIPVEELEKIALETVEDESIGNSYAGKKKTRKKVKVYEKKRSVSPAIISTNRSRRNIKPPNISLIEQIVTDDIPLEELISLEDLENPEKPLKSQKKSQKSRTKPKKYRKDRIQSREFVYDLKECSVRLARFDLEKLLHIYNAKAKLKADSVENNTQPAKDTEKIDTVIDTDTMIDNETVVEEVVNDIQIDMLDVSEDIVIGDVCEVKTDDKESRDGSTPSVSEDIILDNSQSCAEDAVGGEPEDDNVCKTYDFASDETLRRDTITVSGNADAVLALECIDDNFIAACLDGNVYYFSGDGQLLNTLRGSNLAVTCLTIVREKYGTTVYTGSLDSRIRYYDLETGMEKGPECNVLSPIQTMDRAWDTVFVGTRTGFVLQFECKNNMLIPVSTVKFSEQSILALRAMKEGPRKVLLVAARSEAVTIKDAQTGLLLRTLEGPKMTVYTLLFEDGKVYCGTSSHQIHVFDYASGSHAGCHEGGKGAVCLRAAGGLLFAGCYDGCVYIYRETNTAPLAQLRGPALMLLSLAIHGTKIIAGYKDRSLYIWKIPLSILQEMIL